MDAQSPESSSPPSAAPVEGADAPGGTDSMSDAAQSAAGGKRVHARRPRGGLRRLLQNAGRVIDLQYRIWLIQAQLTLRRMALYAALFGAAMLIGLLAIIFLFIGAFHILTDVFHIPPVWAYLIFGGVLALLAITLVLIGTKILSKGPASDEAEDDEEKGGGK